MQISFIERYDYRNEPTKQIDKSQIWIYYKAYRLTRKRIICGCTASAIFLYTRALKEGLPAGLTGARRAGGGRNLPCPVMKRSRRKIAADAACVKYKEQEEILWQEELKQSVYT